MPQTTSQKKISAQKSSADFESFFERLSCELFHDLINPINGLTLFLETLDKEKFSDFVEPINKTSHDIKEFIRIMNMARNNPDRIEIVNVHKISEHIGSLLSYKAIRNDVVILIASRTNYELISANRMIVYQIILNLVSNAIESYANISAKNKSVGISISVDEDGMEISVSDKGCGIKKENFEKIFQQNFTTKDRGLGIGLSHVKKMVENHFHGEILVSSKINRGTIFTIKIPRKFVVNYQ